MWADSAHRTVMTVLWGLYSAVTVKHVLTERPSYCDDRRAIYGAPNTELNNMSSGPTQGTFYIDNVINFLTRTDLIKKI